MSNIKKVAVGFQPLASIFGDTLDQTDGRKIIDARLIDLHPFPGHPFEVREDEEMVKLTDSIASYGVITPGIVRPRSEGGYQLIAGHRRQLGSTLAGLSTMPVEVRDVDDDTATILMAMSNIQREKVKPSEKGKAYKMMLDAIKRQGARTDLTCGRVGHMSPAPKSVDRIAGETGESRKQIQRYIRLTELTPDLLAFVDNNKLPINTAVELSYLRPDEQADVFSIMAAERMKPSMAQATRLKEKSQVAPLTKDDLLSLLATEKIPELRIKLASPIFKQYFPSGYSQEEAEGVIISLLEEWARKAV